MSGKRTVLYTGAAGGLGLPPTLALLDAGWTVVAVDHDPDKLQVLAAAAPGHASLIVRDLDLKKPGYKKTAAYGHFGRPGFSWETTNRLADFKAAVGV